MTHEDLCASRVGDAAVLHEDFDISYCAVCSFKIDSRAQRSQGTRRGDQGVLLHHPGQERQTIIMTAPNTEPTPECLHSSGD